MQLAASLGFLTLCQTVLRSCKAAFSSATGSRSADSAASSHCTQHQMNGAG